MTPRFDSAFQAFTWLGRQESAQHLPRDQRMALARKILREQAERALVEVESVILEFCRACREESGEPCTVPECAAYGRVGPRMLYGVVMLRKDAELYAQGAEDDPDGWRAT